MSNLPAQDKREGGGDASRVIRKQVEERRAQVAELISGGLSATAVGKRLGLTSGALWGDIKYLRKIGLVPLPSQRKSNITSRPVPPPSQVLVAGMHTGKLERLTVSVATCPKCGARFVTESNGR